MAADGGDTEHARRHRMPGLRAPKLRAPKLRAPRRRTSRPRTSRLLAVCAVLLGLFLMHGAPASAAQGCHGGAPRMASMSAAAPTAHHGLAAVAPHEDGGSCLATSPRHRASQAGWTPAPPAVLPSAAAELADRTADHLGGGRRGPPYDGRSVLLRVCVART